MRSTPFERVLREIRAALRDGELRPGAHLSVPELARQKRLSQTPIREALARLAGEGLIDRREGGYFVWTSNAQDWLHLGRLHSLYVAYALMTAPGASPLAVSDTRLTLDTQLGAGSAREAVLVDFVEGIFRQLMRESGNQHVLAAEYRVSDRLRPYRLVEARLLPDAGAEARDLADAYDRGDRDQLWSTVASYFRRRTPYAHAVTTALDDPPK
ncbi:GntR family transcriptional regulator [Caulobacter sp. 73W]|uniref:GntR family transcriptional regulator n=1 Tax=Caulobacter sp. 73W TaxID=3161137 RepID=A0AB39KXH8_9CAUL